MVEERTWKEFKEAGLLWWANRVLHLFGWAIVMVQEQDGSISSCYPARCKFRGFGPESEEKGFVNLTRYLSDNMEDLLAEAEA